MLEEDAVVIDDILQGLEVLALVAFLFVDLESFGHTALDCAIGKKINDEHRIRAGGGGRAVVCVLRM